MSDEMSFSSRTTRRDALKLGGLTVSLAALVAACGDDRSGPDDPGRVGYAPPVTNPPDYPVDDVVLLRTSASIELTAAYALARLLEIGGIDAELVTLMERFIDEHETIADDMNGLAVSAGGEAWECTNPWMMERLIEPLLAAVEESDLQATNVIDAAATIENWTAATSLDLTTMLTDTSASEAALSAAVLESRQAAALIAVARGPEGYISPELSGGEPEPSAEGLPQQYAITSRFGTTNSIELVAGPPDENGVRDTYIFQTPSLNSYVYSELDPSC